MKKAIILAGLAVLAFEAANAETPAAKGTVGRDAAVTMILENDPRLKALAENQKAESTQLSVAGRFNAFKISFFVKKTHCLIICDEFSISDFNTE